MTTDPYFETYRARYPHDFDNTTVLTAPQFAHYLEERLRNAFKIGRELGAQNERSRLKERINETLFPED